jgi:hypothetical protein
LSRIDGRAHPKLSDGSTSGDWAVFGRTYGEQHFVR